MDFTRLFLAGLLGGAAYLYFRGAPLTTSSSAYATAPIGYTPPLLPSAPATPSSTMQSAAAAPSATISSAPVSSPVQSPGTVMTVAPATPAAPQPITEVSGVPDDDAFVAQGTAAYTSSTGISTGKYFNNFVSMLRAQVSGSRIDPDAGNTVGQDHCSGYSTSNTTFASIAGQAGVAAETGLGISSIIGGAGSAAASVASFAIPVIGAALGVVGLIAGIFQHHAQKVKAQSQYDCAACSAANNAWQQIIQAMQQGQVDRSTAYQAFEAVYSQFVSMLQSSPAPPNTAQGNCNNPCNLIIICRTITNKLEATYGLVN